MRSPSIKWIAPLAAFVITVSAVGVAYASTSPGGTTATTARTTATTAAGSTNGSTNGSTGTTGTTEHNWMGRGQQRTGETALTGDVLAKVKAAVLAKIGSDATIMRAETDTDGNAKYEVHAVKADGTHVTVYVNESYAVVSVETGAEGMGTGRGHMGGRGGGETALTGDTLAKVKAAALAAGGNGSTLLRAFADSDNTDTSVKYEAMVKKADGTFLMVYLDSAFKVVKTQAAAQGAGPGGGHRGGHGESSCIDGTAAAPSTSGTTSTTGSI